MNLEKQKVIHKLLEQKYKSMRGFSRFSDYVFWFYVNGKSNHQIICLGIYLDADIEGSMRWSGKDGDIFMSEYYLKNYIQEHNSDWSEVLIHLVKEKYISEP